MLDEIRIRGGIPLQGEVKVQGSKNAALPMMAAVLLCDEVLVLGGCPRISDVFCMEKILNKLGVASWWRGHDLYLDGSRMLKGGDLLEEANRMRSSVILLGAMAARTGEGCIGYPGGCVIGKRPLDLHFYALRKLGIQVEEKHREIIVKGKPKGNCKITFRQKSVGATEQAILASVLTEGEVVIENCAKEPEIQYLAACLNKMGAEISGAGSDSIRIRGRKILHGARIDVPPDRVVAGTYLLAGAATRGKVILSNVVKEELGAILYLYRKMGGQYIWKSGKLITDSRKIMLPISYVETESYPGFSTDLQSPLMAVLTGIPGNSVICEKIFEARYGVAEELKKMGAKIEIQKDTAYITGKKQLRGTRVEAKELRGGAALVIAGLCAEGETVIGGCRFIERGYENIKADIECLGGRIE